MKEIISFSFGKHSNHIATHFWNSQDETLKIIPHLGDQHLDQQQTLSENTQVVYHEAENSQQLIPRHVYIDFAENFGNYLSCFTEKDGIKQQSADEIKNFGMQDQQWFGNMTQTFAQAQHIPQIKFQQELQDIDNMYYQQSQYEQDYGQEDNAYGEENPDENQDHEEDEYGRQIDSSTGGQGLSGVNIQDMFEKMYAQNVEKHDDRVEKKKKYEDNAKKLEDIQKKKPHQLYEDYEFDKDVVRYFTDFMQSQMTKKYNQLLVPSAAQDNFLFFNKGREIWQSENQFKDEMEDKIRHQLELSDLLQGFQITVDSNSGHGSLCNQMISYFLKDEAPKAPIYLYSINNHQKVDEQTVHKDAVNLEQMQDLIDLNMSLFMSESQENVEIMIPIDILGGKQGKNIKPFFSQDIETIFQQSAVEMLIKQNIYGVVQNYKGGMDMIEFAKESRYQGSSVNFLLPQLQIPIQYEGTSRYLEKIQGDQVADNSNFIRFNNYNEIHKNRKPIRHTFILRGTNSIIQKDENPRVFKEQFEQFIFLNTKFERGFQSLLIKDPHYLPIPYPRFLDTKLISQDGLLQPTGTMKPEFLQQMPSMLKLLFDGQYLGHIESLKNKLRNVSAKTRYQLLRENDNMEEDEWREKVNTLEEMVEGYKSIAMNDEPSDSEGNSDDY